eukprot:COSAG01_NODE_35736_length_527_cov_1.193925_2_plen_51_part_01
MTRVAHGAYELDIASTASGRQEQEAGWQRNTAQQVYFWIEPVLWCDCTRNP